MKFYDFIMLIKMTQKIKYYNQLYKFDNSKENDEKYCKIQT